MPQIAQIHQAQAVGPIHVPQIAHQIHPPPQAVGPIFVPQIAQIHPPPQAVGPIIVPQIVPQIAQVHQAQAEALTQPQQVGRKRPNAPESKIINTMRLTNILF